MLAEEQGVLMTKDDEAIAIVFSVPFLLFFPLLVCLFFSFLIRFSFSLSFLVLVLPVTLDKTPMSGKASRGFKCVMKQKSTYTSGHYSEWMGKKIMNGTIRKGKIKIPNMRSETNIAMTRKSWHWPRGREKIGRG